MTNLDPTRPGQMPSWSFAKLTGLVLVGAFLASVLFGSKTDTTKPDNNTETHGKAIVASKLNDKTLCRDVINLFDADDHEFISKTVYYIGIVQGREERQHLANGERAVISNFDPSAKATPQAMAIELCRERPADTLRSVSLDALNAIRQMGTDLGLKE